MLNVPITKNKVAKVLYNCKSGKAPGIDGVVSDTLKNRMSINVLTAMFNACMESHLMPSTWAKAIISPIQKNAAGDPRIPMNYRGISLLSVVAMIYSAVLSNRISGHLESNELLCNEQNSFHPGRSCLDHIFSLYEVCRVRKSMNQETFLIFVDFKKAFDCVEHAFLLHELRNKGITGDIYFAFKSLCANPQSCVHVGGHLTEWFNVTNGVRQGD